MKEVTVLLERARQAECQGDAQGALEALARAGQIAKGTPIEFDVLLWRAHVESRSLSLPERALATYWDARHHAAHHHLERLGEADMGIGMVLLDLGRHGEGLEAIRRAARSFRRTGNTFLRGCAETVLAGEALHAGELGTAERHLEVATDLLQAAGEARMLSNCLTLRAECLARQGSEAHAEALLARAATVARSVGDEHAQAELQQRRRHVRQVIAELLASGALPEPRAEEEE